MAKNLADATIDELRTALANAQADALAKAVARDKAKREAQRLKNQEEVTKVKDDFDFASSGISDWVAGISSHNGEIELIMFDYTRSGDGITLPPEDVIKLRDWLNTLTFGK